MNAFKKALSFRTSACDFFSSLAVVFAGVFASLNPIPPADTWWQLSLGRYMFSHGDVLRENVFSYTAPSFHIVDHEWLAELVFYGLWSAGGMDLLYFFRTLVVCLSLLILYAACRKRGAGPFPSLCACVASAFLANLALFGDVRPYLFTYLFFSLLILFASAFFESDSPFVYFIVPVVWIWSNCHAGYMLFFAVVAIYLFSSIFPGDLVRRPFPDAFKTALSSFGGGLSSLFSRRRNLILAALFSFALAFANPYGSDLVLYPFSFSHDGFFRSHLIEWAAPDLLGANLPFLVFCAVLWTGLIFFRRGLSLFDFLFLGAFSFLAFSAVRHITLFAFASAVPASILAGRVFSLRFRIPGFRPGYSFLPALCLAAMIALAVPAVVRLSSCDSMTLSMEKELFPYYGVQFVRMNSLPGRIAHPYGWGGYLLWKLYPCSSGDYRVFIDGRANVAYTDEVYRESLLIDSAGPGWEEILDRYGVNVVFFSKYHSNYRTDGRNIAERLVESGKWRRLFEEPSGIIFMRVSPATERLWKKAESGGLFMPVAE